MLHLCLAWNNLQTLGFDFWMPIFGSLKRMIFSVPSWHALTTNFFGSSGVLPRLLHFILALFFAIYKTVALPTELLGHFHKKAGEQTQPSFVWNNGCWFPAGRAGRPSNMNKKKYGLKTRLFNWRHNGKKLHEIIKWQWSSLPNAHALLVGTAHSWKIRRDIVLKYFEQQQWELFDAPTKEVVIKFWIELGYECIENPDDYGIYFLIKCMGKEFGCKVEVELGWADIHISNSAHCHAQEEVHE